MMNVIVLKVVALPRRIRITGRWRESDQKCFKEKERKKKVGGEREREREIIQRWRMTMERNRNREIAHKRRE